MQGRKAIPIDIKKAKGTYRAHRDKGKPDVSEEKPFPPKALVKREKQIFNLLTKRLGDRATASYTEIQAMCAQRLCEIEEYNNTIEKEGATFKTSNSFGDSIIKEHPACALREKAIRHAQSLLAAMGLTHVDGLKFGTGKKKEKKNEFEGF